MPDGGLSPDAAVARSVAALADPTHEAIVRLLIDGELSVGEIAERLPVSRPAVSKHLRVLEGAGLAVVRAEGTRRLYTIEPTTLGALRDELDRMWQRALARFALVPSNSPDALSARLKPRTPR